MPLHCCASPQEQDWCPWDIPGSCTRGRGSGSARGTGRRSGCGHSADCLRTCREEGVGSGLSGYQLQGPRPERLSRVRAPDPGNCCCGSGALGGHVEGQRWSAGVKEQRLRRLGRVTGPLGIPDPLSCRASLICPGRECQVGHRGLAPRWEEEFRPSQKPEQGQGKSPGVGWDGMLKA